MEKELFPSLKLPQKILLVKKVPQAKTNQRVFILKRLNDFGIETHDNFLVDENDII